MLNASVPADRRPDHMQEWRDTAKQVVRAYKAWSASTRSDRHRLYLAFLEALRREEQAARRVERDASGASS